MVEFFYIKASCENLDNFAYISFDMAFVYA